MKKPTEPLAWTEKITRKDNISMFKVNNHKRHSILVRFAAYMALTLFALGMNELRSVQKAISYQ